MTTQTTSPLLLSPFKIGDLSLKNRVVMAPLTRARAGEARMPNALMTEYYTQRASAGLIITEATVVSTQANGWLNTPGIYSDEQGEAWKQIVTAVHAHETPIFMQLWHTGRASHSSFHENNQLPVAASAIKINGEGIHTPLGKQPYETPRALETDEISLVVEDYRKAAERAKMAGFDGVEIHAANGYLIDTFLQTKTNHRTDSYGGTVENRYRFLKEIVEAIITVFPANKVGVRLSPNGIYNDMGSPEYREDFLYFAAQLNAYDLAYLHLVDGLAFGFHELGTPMMIAEFRDVFAGPLVGNCGYTQEQAETALSSKVADLIAFGRDFISNPDLVERFTNGWPLNPPAEVGVWYSFGPEGYIDFPRYQESQAIS
ncbi:alkene reductase [Microcoleus vaginatus PCC 9802]|uniref:alkene reductase n=1 Tax=Microcoleus vaginatus TaxID=119532 RepID=UPI00020D29EB|nr:12-oxophytodienoate reductase [Microcoleus vaginatus FGP-2]UNU21857.1 alkene reductase [Microcoleus vaginatus PCC 9802]